MRMQVPFARLFLFNKDRYSTIGRKFVISRPVRQALLGLVQKALLGYVGSNILVCATIL